MATPCHTPMIADETLEMQNFFGCLRNPGFASSNFTPYHTEYLLTKLNNFGNRKSVVTDFIILAKYWFKQDVKEMFPSTWFTSYAIELVSLAVAETAFQVNFMIRRTLNG
jgi:hypothetical protein